MTSPSSTWPAWLTKTASTSSYAPEPEPDAETLAAQYVVRLERPAKSQALKEKVLQQIYRKMMMLESYDRVQQLIQEAKDAFNLLAPPPVDPEINGMAPTSVVIDEIEELMGTIQGSQP